VVPRAWTIYFAEMAGTEVPDDLPQPWIEAAGLEAGHEVPRTLMEPIPHAPDTSRAVRSVVDRIRQEIFPARGL